MILFLAIDLYGLVVVVSVVLSWIPAARGTAFEAWVRKLTEPALERIRRVVPPMAGFDLSPMLLLLGLQILKRLLVSLI